MEDSLGHPHPCGGMQEDVEVLILVVMEDSLGLYVRLRQMVAVWVLILVVMEDSLGPGMTYDSEQFRECLNPCCNGR